MENRNVNARVLLEKGKFTIKNELHDLMAIEMTTRGTENSCFLLINNISKKNMIYDWEELSKLISELNDWSEIELKDISFDLPSNIKLEI